MSGTSDQGTGKREQGPQCSTVKIKGVLIRQLIVSANI